MWRQRTKAGILLEKLLSNNPHRYLWCWNGEESDTSPYDCACCMTWLDDELMHRCGCICHERIEEMAAQRHIKLWLTALSYTDELPPFFTSYGEKLDHSKPIAEQHKVHTAMLLERAAGKYPVRDCTCEPCEFVRNDVHRQFKLPGEEGYEDVAVPAKGKRCEVCDTPFESEHIWCDPCIQETIEKEKEG